jgi:hypothetical protein
MVQWQSSDVAGRADLFISYGVTNLQTNTTRALLSR